MLNPEARIRLKTALVKSGRGAKEVSVKLGWPPTYVSRVTTGGIENPSASRLSAICEEIGADLSYIISGNILSEENSRFLTRLANEDADVIKDVANYVRDKGLMKSSIKYDGKSKSKN